MAFRTRIAALAAIAALFVAGIPAATANEHDDVLHDAIEAIGGADALANLESFRTEATGTRWTIDEGPFPGSGAAAPGPFTTTASFDVTNDRQRLDTELVSYFVFARTLAEVVTPDGGFVDGQDNNFAPPFTAPMLSDRWVSTRMHQRLINPTLILLDAMANPDRVTTDGDALVFDLGGAPLYLEFDRRTGLPARASTIESDPLRRDVPMVVTYGRWTEEDGLAFPMGVRVTYDGELVRHERRSSVEVNPDLDLSLFDFPQGIEPEFDAALAHRGVIRHQHIQSFAALGFPRDGVQPFVEGTEIGNGVYHLTGGSHHSLAVVQENGVTIVEAPLDEVRVAAILDWVDANIGLPVDYVVPSHHHADHSGGVRQVVAAGATLVVHQSAARFFRNVLRAPSELVPDGIRDLQRRPRIATVSDGGSYVIDDAVNPVGIHTLETDHAGDMVLIDVGGVLFTADIYSPGAPPTEEADPILPRVVELGLDIDTVAGAHGATIGWDDFVALFE